MGIVIIYYIYLFSYARFFYDLGFFVCTAFSGTTFFRLVRETFALGVFSKCEVTECYTTHFYCYSHEELVETEILVRYLTAPRAIFRSLGRIRTCDHSIRSRSNRFLHYMHVIVIVQRNFARGD